MSSNFASGKHAHGFCDRCGFRCDYHAMKKLVVNERLTNIKVCPACYEPDQPQYRVGKLKVIDPQGLREPRPDTSLEESRELL